MKHKSLSYVLFLLVIPAVSVLGLTVFRSAGQLWLSLLVSVLSMAPFFLSFEKKPADLTKTVLVAGMVALSVGGRILFSALPGFKPVTAIVILTALYFGADAGFLTGSLAALLSNFYFGQGPWTPFQMAAWGFLGFFAGLFAERFKKSWWLLGAYGAVGGAVYSLILNVQHALFVDGVLTAERYWAVTVASLWYTAIYAVSNVVFLLVLRKPVGKILERVSRKYGLNENQGGGTVIRKVSFSEGKTLIDTKKDLLLVDVREEEEYITGHAVNAVLFTLDTINAETAAQTIPSKDTPVMVYCRSGRRSKEAAHILADLGYTEIYDLGGLIGWPYGLE